MSGICGVVNLDGRPADRELLHSMAARMSHRGPNGIRYWAEGPAALAHAALHTTPESLREVQPLISPSGLLCLTFEGRVDNREELKAALEDKSILLRDDTDAELVLGAYELWGEGCAARILGDFAFAIWDGARHYLFCARDILGVKPFYYSCDKGRFLFASELAQILEDPTIGRDVNEGMVGEFLSFRVTNREDLVQRDYRLAAHFLVVGPKSFVNSGTGTSISRNSALCEAGRVFRSVFRNLPGSRSLPHAKYRTGRGAAKRRTRFLLGLEWRNASSARDLLSARGFETFSNVFPGMGCDETPFIRDVADMWGLHSNIVMPKLDTRKFAEEVRNTGISRPIPGAGFQNDMIEIQARRGFRVILTGWGGDDWLAGDEYPHADLLRGFKIHALLQQIRSDRAQLGLARSGSRLLMWGILPLLPRAVRFGLRRIRSATGLGTTPWIRPEFAKRIQLQDRIEATFEGRKFQSYMQKTRYRHLVSGWTAFVRELWDRSMARYGIELRHPLADRRVIEFAFALPQERLYRDGRTKIILRSAMRDLLPGSVRERGQ